MNKQTFLLEKTEFINAMSLSENKYKLALQTIKHMLQHDIILYEKIDENDYGNSLNILDVINLSLDNK